MSENRARPGRIAFISLIGAAILLRLFGVWKTVGTIDAALFITLVGGYRIFYEAFVGLFRKKISADLAVSIAAIAALVIGESLAAAEVIFIMLIGQMLESLAGQRTGRAIELLAALAPKRALVERAGREETIPLDQVTPGDVVILRPGERVPVDGKVLSGRCLTDESALTGEAMPIAKSSRDRVLAGTFIVSGTARVHVESVGPASVLGKVVDLVRSAKARKAPTERLADRYVKFFVPFVVLAALATYFVTRQPLRAVSVLIIACPCALVLATPAAVVSAIGRLAREGILVKGGQFLELAGKVNCVMFDKTGTLTRGKPAITKIMPIAGLAESDLLGLAAAAELRSEHLLAHVIVSGARERNIPLNDPQEFASIVSSGVVSQVGADQIIVGSEKLMEERGVAMTPWAKEEAARLESDGATAVFVARGAALLGLIAIADEPRPEAAHAVDALRSIGVSHIELLTGDARATAESVARRVGIQKAQGRLLPQDKVKVISDAQRQGLITAMVGDGINDAPALTQADLGIAMGGIGIDVSIEAADVVVMTDDLTRIPELIRVGRNALAIIKENILGFAIAFNAAAMLGASWGLFKPITAAVVHQVSSLLVIANSLRLLSTGRLGRRSLVGTLHAVAAVLRGWHLRLRALSWRDVARLLYPRRKSIAAVASGLALLAYLASGTYMVRSHQNALVLRFGRIRNVLVPPGLHYHVPWPFETIRTFSLTGLRRVEIGYTVLQAQQAPGAITWAIPHVAAGSPSEFLMPTGDENLVTFGMTVQYSVADPAKFLFRASDPETIVKTASEAALRSVMATESLESALATRRLAVEDETAARLTSLLSQLGLGVKVEQLRLTEIHPPREVIEAYRRVASAFEEKDKLIDLAEAYRNRRLGLAKGQAEAEVSRARGFAAQRVASADGESNRFKNRYNAYLASPQLTRMRLLIESMESILKNVPKYILYVPASSPADVLFLPGMSGVMLSPAAGSESAPYIPTEEQRQNEK